MTRISRYCISQHQFIDCRLPHSNCLLVSRSAVDNGFSLTVRHISISNATASAPLFGYRNQSGSALVSQTGNKQTNKKKNKN
ncbi:hypothetical protein OUZ56_030155 [Daphnia magna]|uniref:Uncharacterized protein n=1 Tax=Daphnia magna TaxID=35525 RepID=A0ABQ9ZQF8_9CRUS|nr:hypothetical protein OUZ56_030155 [Daphnia magna]